MFGVLCNDMYYIHVGEISCIKLSTQRFPWLGVVIPRFDDRYVLGTS
jgi:hypothetical protein